MKPLFLSIGIVAAGLATMAGFLYRSNSRLRSDLEAMRQQNREIAVLEAQRDRFASIAPARAKQLRERQAEISSLQAQIVVLTAQLAALESSRNKPAPIEAAPPTVSLAPGMMTVESMQNVGRATPQNALQTGMWAQNQKDLPAIMESFAFGTDAKAKLEALFRELPDEERTRFGSADRLAAIVTADVASSRGNAPPLQFTERSRSGDTAEVAIQMQLPDGQIREARTLSLRLFPDGWKVVLPAQEVEALGSYLNALPPAQRKALIR
jgi:uncharacterized coiled-coil protein SlyX